LELTSCGVKVTSRNLNPRIRQKRPFGGHFYRRCVRWVHENGSVGFRRPPERRPNAEFRSREYLTSTEVERLIAGGNRYVHRDATMVLIGWGAIAHGRSNLIAGIFGVR